MATDTDSWFPLFEFQDWFYQSFLVLPTDEEINALPGSPVTAKKWARGDFLCGQAFGSASSPGPYTLNGILRFAPGVELNVSAKGVNGVGNEPAPFEATGTGTGGPTKGAIYQLAGWVFPELPIANAAGRILSIRGSVRVVRGSDTKPETELGGMPVGTVGTFVIVSRGPA
jgi:hypothetical protein